MESSNDVPRPRVERSLSRHGARNGFVPRSILGETSGVRSAPGGGLGDSQSSPHPGMLTGHGRGVRRYREARCVGCFQAKASRGCTTTNSALNIFLCGTDTPEREPLDRSYVEVKIGIDRVLSLP